MDYKETIKFWSKVWKNLEEYAETLHWGYIGAIIFIILFAAFLYDSLASSQVSLKFLFILMIFMCAVYYFGMTVIGGMSSGI